MRKEERIYGQISDGAGKRFVLFELFFLIDDNAESKEYIEWYQEKFPEDSWGPIQLLPWALILYRMEQRLEARRKLAQLMLSNLYFIPKIIGVEVREHTDVWHASNLEWPSYFDCVIPEVLEHITAEEREWMSQMYHSVEFTKVRERYICLRTELNDTSGFQQRSKLCDACDALLDNF